MVNTCQHEADPRILITDSMDGLSAIQDTNVKAVIWERTLDDAVLDAVHKLSDDDIETYKHHDNIGAVMGEILDSTKKFKRANKDKTHDVYVCNYDDIDYPPALMKDIKTLSLAFKKATGCSFIETDFGRSWTTNAVEQENSTQPHKDTQLSHRMFTVYEGRGFLYMPGDFTKQEMRKILASDNIENMRGQYNINALPRGHVILLQKGIKDETGTVSEEENWLRNFDDLLIHASPPNSAGERRVVAQLEISFTNVQHTIEDAVESHVRPFPMPSLK